MLLINFTGAPGAGKSTTAAGVFHRLKTRHWNVELVTEYTKELLLTQDSFSLSDELLIFAEKYRRIKKMESVDIVITDSPLINSTVYGDERFGGAAPAFYEAVACSFDSLYFSIERKSAYIPLGRMPDPDAAETAGRNITDRLRDIDAALWTFPGQDAAIPAIVDIIESEAHRRRICPLLRDDIPQAAVS